MCWDQFARTEINCENVAFLSLFGLKLCSICHQTAEFGWSLSFHVPCLFHVELWEDLLGADLNNVIDLP